MSQCDTGLKVEPHCNADGRTRNGRDGRDGRHNDKGHSPCVAKDGEFGWPLERYYPIIRLGVWDTRARFVFTCDVDICVRGVWKRRFLLSLMWISLRNGISGPDVGMIQTAGTIRLDAG